MIRNILYQISRMSGNADDSDLASACSEQSQDDTRSPCIPLTSPDAEIEKGDSLKNKLLQLNLNEENVKYILENGERFSARPGILAKKLDITVDQAKKAVNELKAYQRKQIFEEVEKFEKLVKENSELDLEEIALLHDIPDNVVKTFLENLETSPLTEGEKVAIKELLNDGFSMTEIASELKLSQKKISEYVENTFISFTGKDGGIALEIINKYLGKCPIGRLREMIVKKDVTLQEKICYELPRKNESKFEDVKKYFMKFEESRKFFEIEETLSIEAKVCIKSCSLDDVRELSLKLNRMERVIRDYLLRYSQDEEFMLVCAQKQLKQIQNMITNFESNTQISHSTYRMIISDSFDNLIQNAKGFHESPPKVFHELLPLTFYYLKCSLPLGELTQIISSIMNIHLTTLDLFHLIFQMSDPVVRGLCIEHYSFSNPVPFYYPILSPYPPEQTSCQFEICKELWYSLQQFSGLVSFGLGWASWNPIGKSHLLDLMFETDFVKGSPQNSPFHLGSIDIQMTKNLFGDRIINESTDWGYIDCNGYTDTNIIKDICEGLDIALIHVTHFDFTENYSRIAEDLETITSNTKYVYLLVRDCPENDIKRQRVSIGHDKVWEFILIPNLIKCDVKSLFESLRKIGYEILHSTIENSRLVESNFLESLIIPYSSWCNFEMEKTLIGIVKNDIHRNIQDTSTLDFSFLSYYPHFVEYMRCYYEASSETDQGVIDELNDKCKFLNNHLENSEMISIAWHFNEILAQENSTLILWKLSQELKMLSKQISSGEKRTYNLEILWREALLSSRYNLSFAFSQGKIGNNSPESFSTNFSDHVERGEPFELIDGDNLRFFNQDINILLSKFYKSQNNETISFKTVNRPPIVVSIFGPQSSGKSTLLNYCFGCKFLTSAGRCTKGIYASLSKLSQPINNSDHFLILDTEGLDAIEKGKNIQKKSGIHFDRTMVLFCLAVSQVVIINVKGDLGEEMQNLLQICAYSLNKLKVSKVKAPKIFFVLNQQADPDPDKHLNSINTLLEKLNEESDLMETEGLKISELIQVSEKNLFVLPSAFNSESLNTQMTKLFDSDLSKLFPTNSFANKCASLRMSIISQLKNEGHISKTNSNNMPFNTMDEWMEMSGVIWDTIIKYQDIVKYRNTDELRCSNKFSKILSYLMVEKNYSKKGKYQDITEKLMLRIKKISKWSHQSVILEEVKKELDEAFENNQEEALKEFAVECKSDPLLRKMNYMCDEAKSNLCRLIYMEKKIYEDKLKLEIKARLTEIKLTENMSKFQQAIEKNVDKYFELTIEELTIEFERIWTECFGGENKDEEDDELEEKFNDLYSVFRMESKTMENKPTINTLFRTMRFEMDKIIEAVSGEMLSKFCTQTYNFSETDQFIYPWKENRVPLKGMIPYLVRGKFEYLCAGSLYKITKLQASKPDLKFREWVPHDCHPLLKYCSGYYNHPDVIWMLERRKQILLLASKLKDPNNFKRSTWRKFIDDISRHVHEFINEDPSISHSTVKEIVDFLCRICKVVNYEINFIEAKLTNAAERTISTYAFAIAFKSLLGTKKEKQRKDELNQIKEKDLLYFLQKVENQKLTRGNWDRPKMREGDKKMANKFARDFLAAVCRGVSIECKQNINERYFNMHRNKLSYNSILLLAKEKVKKEFDYYNPIDQSNFVVQFICNQTQTLKTLFQEEWLRLANRLQNRIIGDMKKIFTSQVSTVISVFKEFLEGLTAECRKSERPEPIGLDADSNFEAADNPPTEVVAVNSDSKAKLIPFKAMVIFLELYLNPNVSSSEFNNIFNNGFKVDGINMKKHDNYVLFEKPHNPAQKLFEPAVLDNEMYKTLSDTNMFKSTETIFNIKAYVQEFLRALNCYEFQVPDVEYRNILKETKEEFESHIINCPHTCPSCGKFCEKEIHPQEGKCRILTGHQICSMGGNVWNNNEDKTAILLMCEDYKEDSTVLIPGQNMKWWEFKEKCGDQWDWSLPTDEEYVALQKENRDKMKKIWNKYGKEMLNYYASRGGTHITYIPYTSPEEIYRSLYGIKYYICFVIDGTNFMAEDIKYAKKWVKEAMRNSQLDRPSNFRAIVYHGHHNLKKFPDNSEFTSDDKSVENFLMNIYSYGYERNEFPMLHGLATAAKKSNWKSGFEFRNIIIHYYVEPTDGHFDILTAEGKCDKCCQFDWRRDISDRMHEMDIQYKCKRLILHTHPQHAISKLLNDQTTSGIDLQSGQKSMTKAAIYIDYKTDH